MTEIPQLVSELTDLFRRHHHDKGVAHERSWPILKQAAGEPRILRSVLETFLSDRRALAQRSFPSVTMFLAQNAYFGLVANCFIPNPSTPTHLSTTAIHHHGDMMLSTCTIFGPGYDHLYFEEAQRVDPAQEIFKLDLVDERPHPKGHVLFVDAWRPHCPLYPRGVTVTLALWSHRFPVTWRDRLKRLPFLRGHEVTLRKIGSRFGLTKALDLRLAEYYDYYPSDRGFIGMRIRQQVPRGPVADHIRNVLTVVQTSGEESVLPRIASGLRRLRDREAREAGESLLEDVRRGRPVEPRLAPNQFPLQHMHFTRQEIDRALSVQRARENGRACELAAS